MAEALVLGIVGEVGGAVIAGLLSKSIKNLMKRRKRNIEQEFGPELSVKKVLGDGVSRYEELMIRAATIGEFYSVKVTTTRRSMDGYYSDLLEGVLDTSGLENFVSSTDSLMKKIENMDVDGAIRMVIRPATRKIVAPADAEKVHALIMSYLVLSENFEDYGLRNVNNEMVMIRGNGLHEVRISTWWSDFGELYAMVDDGLLSDEKVSELEREVDVRNYYVIGEAGAGKSFIANCLSGQGEFIESRMGTGTIWQEETRIIENDISCRVWDTVGLADFSYKTGEVERRLGELMHCNRTFSKIILVLKPVNRKDVTTASLLKVARYLLGTAADRLCVIINMVDDEQQGKIMVNGLKKYYGEYVTDRVFKNLYFVVKNENRGRVYTRLRRIFDPHDTPIFARRATGVYFALSRLRKSKDEDERKELRNRLKTETGDKIDELTRILAQMTGHEILDTGSVTEVKIKWKKIKPAGYEEYVGEDWRMLSGMRVTKSKRKIHRRTALITTVVAIHNKNAFSEKISKLKEEKSSRRFKKRLIRLVNEFTKNDGNVLLDLINDEVLEWQLRLFSLDKELDSSVDATLAKVAESLRTQAVAYVEYQDFGNVRFSENLEESSASPEEAFEKVESL